MRNQRKHVCDWGAIRTLVATVVIAALIFAAYQWPTTKDGHLDLFCRSSH